MYCYTVANSINCVVRELALWSKLSSQHPEFLRTVAYLSRIRLSKKIVHDLFISKEKYEEIYKCTEEYCEKLKNMYFDPVTATTVVRELKKCLKRFLEIDLEFIQVLKELKKYGQKDQVWQTLLEHIEQEQRYMYRLFQTLMMQIGT